MDNLQGDQVTTPLIVTNANLLTKHKTKWPLIHRGGSYQLIASHGYESQSKNHENTVLETCRVWRY